VEERLARSAPFVVLGHAMHAGEVEPIGKLLPATMHDLNTLEAPWTTPRGALNSAGLTESSIGSPRPS
jgi:hypothetical protein